jgi:hypothetical protein
MTPGELRGLHKAERMFGGGRIKEVSNTAMDIRGRKFTAAELIMCLRGRGSTIGKTMVRRCLRALVAVGDVLVVVKGRPRIWTWTGMREGGRNRPTARRGRHVV